VHPEDVKAEIRKRYGTVKAFEAAEGLPPTSVRDVLRGRPSRRTAQAIANCLGRPIATLFPGRFSVEAEDTSQKRDAHRLTGEAR